MDQEQDEHERLLELHRVGAARLDRIEAIQQTQAGLITNVALQLQEVGRRIGKLADLQQHTDGRLNIVISQVDELIRRWGEQQKPQ